ncbi:hypothetical protein [Baaleninema sp.]|uniref:hypothetical protein n=1 Tax=Baaleninema sp. TaxID=3101197 RepID=UPI003D03784D
MNAQARQLEQTALREDIRDYVAHLQFHMTLQARNLVPNLSQAADSREQLLHNAQAEFEKQVSRQASESL